MPTVSSKAVEVTAAKVEMPNLTSPAPRVIAPAAAPSSIRKELGAELRLGDESARLAVDGVQRPAVDFGVIGDG